jgi:PIN domain nuclease of toxin-antitoxin system
MRALADTNLFIKLSRRLPVPKKVLTVFADEETERCLSPISVLELYRLWQAGRVPDNPDAWLFEALTSWTVLPVTVDIARQSVIWPWPHRDPADRLIAATAKIHNVELWHTDTVLKTLSGFPARYFTNISEGPPAQSPA